MVFERTDTEQQRQTARPLTSQEHEHCQLHAAGWCLSEKQSQTGLFTRAVEDSQYQQASKFMHVICNEELAVFLSSLSRQP